MIVDTSVRETTWKICIRKRKRKIRKKININIINNKKYYTGKHKYNVNGYKYNKKYYTDKIYNPEL